MKKLPAQFLPILILGLTTMTLISLGYTQRHFQKPLQIASEVVEKPASVTPSPTLLYTVLGATSSATPNASPSPTKKAIRRNPATSPTRTPVPSTPNNKQMPAAKPVSSVTIPKGSLSVSVWTPYWDEGTVLATLSRHKQKFQTVSPVWYRINSEGQIEAINAAKKEDTLATLRSTSAKLIPTIQNSSGKGFDASRISRLLESRGKRDEFAEFLIREASEHGYHGWDLDLEKLERSKKDEYVSFVREIKEKLTTKGLQLSITIAPRDPSYDLKALSASATLIRLMAYDFHYHGTRAGPITPINDMEEAVNQFKASVPVEKLVVGLPTFGYDWQIGNVAGHSFKSAQAKLAEHNQDARRDTISGELTAKYSFNGAEHEFWLVDKVSTEIKLDRLKKLGVTKVIFWRMGGEDEGIWNLFE